MTSAVYRIYDHSGDLMYLGLSDTPKQRVSHHRCHQPWGYFMEAYKVREYSTRERAAAVERRAIAILRPRFDRSNNTRDPRAKVHRPFKTLDQVFEDAETCNHNWAKQASHLGKFCLKCAMRDLGHVEPTREASGD